MDQQKLAAAKAAIGVIGGKTKAGAQAVADAQACIEQLAAQVRGGSTNTAHRHQGLLNVTVFDLGAGLKARVNAYVGKARPHMEQFDLE